MRNAFLILILLTICSPSNAQDRFANAITSLNTELDFIPTTDSYLISTKTNAILVSQFRKCAEFEQLEKLTDLNFEDIMYVKSSELITSKWKGKWQIEFQEWEFQNEECATDFIVLLNDLQRNQVQFCVSKGGIMWWRLKDKIYIVTSRAYFVTYHYDEIEKVIKSGLKI